MTQFPTIHPDHGLCLPARFVRCRDGDTPVVSILGTEKGVAIRLIGVDCPERDTKEGERATAFASSILTDAPDLTLQVPIDEQVNSIFDLLSFDRMLGYLWIGRTALLNKMLIDYGHGAYARGWRPNDGS